VHVRTGHEHGHQGHRVHRGARRDRGRAAARTPALITRDNLRRAIAKLVNAPSRPATPNWWGSGTACASDSKKFGSWESNLMTEWHQRYGGPGVMIYWHVERRSTCIYSQLKNCSSSEVAAMIEGLLRHCTDAENDANPIRWELVAQQYDQMVKYATALRLGTAESESILRRFTRGGPKHPTTRPWTNSAARCAPSSPAIPRLAGAAARDSRRAAGGRVHTLDGHGRLELTKFHTPLSQDDNRHAPANTPGIRHVAFAVEDIDAVVAGLQARSAELVGELERDEDSYRLCYVRGPEGVTVELVEKIS